MVKSTSLTKQELRPFQLTVNTIWKYATRSTENLLKHKLEKEIQSKISEMTSLASFKFTKCQFGESVPEILHISTRGRGDTLQYVLDLKWEAADAQIAVQVGALSAGLKGIHVRCAVLIGLAPLLPVVPVVGGSLIAGFASAFFSLPFDFVKTQVQKMKPDPVTGEMPYKGPMDCAAKQLKAGGLLRLWAGFPTYYAKMAPQVGIALIMQDQIKGMWRAMGV